MSPILDNVIQLLNLGVGDIGRLEHIKSSLEENKTLYSSDRNYVEKLIEQHIQKQDRSEPTKKSISDKTVERINPQKKKWIFSKKKNFECPECNEKFVKRDELLSHGQTVHNQTIRNCSLCKASFFSPQSMMEHTKDKHHKVSVGWQLVFLFMPFVNLWAYYRIKRLGDGIVLAIAMNFLFVGGIMLFVIFGMIYDPDLENDLTYYVMALTVWPLLGITIWLKIHYMIKWSREWNKKIDVVLKDTSEDKNSQNPIF